MTERNNQATYYICRKLYMYQFLTEKGIKPFRTDIDRYDSKKNVWFYTNNEQLKEYIDEYYILEKERTKDMILVYTVVCAKELLKRGYTIVDLKKDKYDEDGKRTIFIFKREKDIENAIKEIGYN